MPAKTRRAATKTAKVSPPRSIQDGVQDVLAALKRGGSAKLQAQMPARYGIHTGKAFGVMMRDMQTIANGIGTDHALALHGEPPLK